MHPPLAQPAHCVMSQAWPGHVAGLAPPCSMTGPTASQTPSAVCCSPCRALYQRAGRRVACPMHRIVVLPPAVPHLSSDTTQRPSRPPIMIRPFILRHNPPAAKPSRACLSPLHASQSCRRASRPCRSPAALCRCPFSGLIVVEPA